ncbi:unnamed protein product [Leptosia nina]|uniref:Uncharacterized protein n=1 Tax=Leptosia nina TaxID=320188 RepID=A0AAV1JQ50_9NEOP
MTIAFKPIKLLTLAVGKSPAYHPLSQAGFRTYADKSKAPTTTKHVAGTQKEERVRVRRARPIDVPRVLRFVKEHAKTAWPSLRQNNSQNIVLTDFMARTLAQGNFGFLKTRFECASFGYLNKMTGHSMLAEQQESKRSWGEIRGLALNTAVCPWDAALLEKWARCVQCTRSRQLMLFTAHCLRAPGLHDKYNVHAVLQVVLLVPPNVPKASEVARLLAKNALHRGRDTGFPVLREKALSGLNLQKEWEFFYEVTPDSIKECTQTETLKEDKASPAQNSDSKPINHIKVYSAFPLRK